MCTLSLFRQNSGYKVFMNRDERHDRVAELAPKLIAKDPDVFAPIDPQSGGTWIAHNNKGFWGCLLNGYFENATDSNASYQSRGEILPNLLSSDNPLESIEAIDASRYLSFRLVVGSAHAHRLFIWDGKNYREGEFHAAHDNRAFFLTSSSWNQEEVISMRTKLFEQWAQNPANEISNDIPTYHYSQEPNREAAIFMMRSYSGTKSITALDVNQTGVQLAYHTMADKNPMAIAQ